MTYAGWLLTTPDVALRQQILDRAMGLVCEHFQLCAAAACACLSGVGDTVCMEATAGDRFPIRLSEGPGWSASAVLLENSVRVDLHIQNHLLHREIHSLEHALRQEFNSPVMRMAGSGGNHY